MNSTREWILSWLIFFGIFCLPIINRFYWNVRISNKLFWFYFFFYHYNHFSNARVASELQDEGVIVNLGAHGQREGLAAHWEMWMFDQGGMTGLETIRASTLDPARYLGLDKNIGSLEVGKLADLMVIDGNPLENIRITDSVDYTMINGRLFDAAKMQEMGKKKRELMYFEK